MPTKKPVIQAVIDEMLYNKLKKICTIEERSTSYITEKAISNFIEKYENEHGKIELPPETR